MICEFSGNIFSTVVDVERVRVVVESATARVVMLMSFILVWALEYDEIVEFWAAADDEIGIVLGVVCGSIVVNIGVVCASVDEMGVVLNVNCPSVAGQLGVVCASVNDEMGVVLDTVRELVELLASVVNVNPVTDGGWHDSIRNIMATSTTDLHKSILK